jgi:hypothetical protein
MKSLIIVLLVLAVSAALFLTRPTKADFEKYIRDTTQIVNGKPTGGKTITQTVGEKLRTFTADEVNRSAADLYLEQCEFQNRVLWTDVKKNGKLVYTGAVGHWFKRGEG